MSRAEPKQAARPYRMRRRAEHVDSTRRRIIEATVALHGSVGPAGTTFVSIAERAGVTRATLYRHFNDEDELFAACSQHWLAQQVPPDPGAWARLADPESRLRAGLSDLYRFYRNGESMLLRIYRDIEFVPDQHRRGLRAREEQFRELLLAAFAARFRRGPRLRALIGHAVSFWTWRSLCIDNGLSNDAAVAAMVHLVVPHD